MTDKATFKVGDKIIRYGRVWRIFKIKPQKSLNGDKVKSIFYRPLFPINKNGKLVFSLPLANISQAAIRKPMSKNRIGRLLGTLSEKPKTKKDHNLVAIKAILEKNRFTAAVDVLRRLWWQKKKNLDQFTASKQGVLDNAMKKITEEVACVYGLTLKEAKLKIKKKLHG